MFLYAQIYWLAEFGDVSWLQFNYLQAEWGLRYRIYMQLWHGILSLSLRPRRILSDDFKSDTLSKSDETLCQTWEYERRNTWSVL